MELLELVDGEWRPVTRPTRTGNDAVVYVITAKGAEWLT
jgi:hypothetical protein